MLPYMAQGANSALEDAAVLGSLIAKAQDRSDLPGILQVYQRLRKPRSLEFVEGSLKQVISYHLTPSSARLLIGTFSDIPTISETA